MPVPAVISGLLRALASGGKVAKNVPRADPRLLQGVTRADPRLLPRAPRLVGESTTGASPAYTPATVRTTPGPSVNTPVVPSPFRVTPFGGPELEIEDQPVEPAVAPGGGNRLSDVFETFEIENRPIFPVLENRQAPPAQPAAPARMIVPQTRDEQLEAYENFGKNIPGTIDIGAQSFKIAGPSDIGQRATVPIPGAGAGQMRPAAAVANLAAPGSADIATRVAKELGFPQDRVIPDGASRGPVPEALMNNVTPAAAASAQDGGGFFSNLLKGGILDSESPLSRQQRVMLGVAALKDAGNALEGKSTNFFGDTQKTIAEASQPDYGTPSNQRLAIQQYTEAMNEALMQVPGSTRQQSLINAARAYEQYIPPQTLLPLQANFQEILQGKVQPNRVGETPNGDQEYVPLNFESQNNALAASYGSGEAQYATIDDLDTSFKSLLRDFGPRDGQEYIVQNQARQELLRDEASKFGKVADDSERQLANLIDAYKLADEDFTTGIFAQTLGWIGVTDAGQLVKDMNTIKANIGFQQLMELKEAKTSLGQVAIVELIALQNSIDALDTSMSEEAVKKNLKDVIRHYYRSIDRIMNGRANESPAARRQRESLIKGIKIPQEKFDEALAIMGGKEADERVVKTMTDDELNQPEGG